MKFVYLTEADLLEIHAFVVEETTGSHGLRDRDAINSAVALPRQKVFGKELYPDIYAKAAIYVRSIVFNHPFVDGNKRIAIAAAGVFLEDNGYLLVPPQGEIEKFVLTVVAKKYDIADIAAWLKKHSKKIQ